MQNQGSISYKANKADLAKNLKLDQIRFFIEKSSGVLMYQEKDGDPAIPFNSTLGGNGTGETENQNYTIENFGQVPNPKLPLKTGQIFGATFIKGNISDNPTFSLLGTPPLPLIKPGFIPLKAGDIQPYSTYLLAYIEDAGYLMIGNFYKNLFGTTGPAETTDYTVSVDKVIDVLQDGYTLDVLFAKANTGTATLKVNDTAAVDVVKKGLLPLLPLDIALDNTLLKLVYIKSINKYMISSSI